MIKLLFLLVAALVAFLVVVGVSFGDLGTEGMLALSLFFGWLGLAIPSSWGPPAP
jgi:hypothetical protein